MQTAAMLAAPILWSRLYAAGVRRGRAGFFYQVVAGMCAAQLGLAACLPSTGLREKKKTARSD